MCTLIKRVFRGGRHSRKTYSTRNQIKEIERTLLAVHYDRHQRIEFYLYKEAPMVVRIDYKNGKSIRSQLQIADHFYLYYDRHHSEDGFAIISYEAFDKIRDYLGHNQGSIPPPN